MNRKKTKEIKIGSAKIGNYSPITIQSMTNTNTSNINATVNQINELADIGCEIIRVAVPNTEAANAIKSIISQVSIPLVADIHFDYKIALESIAAGVDKLRINPGNIGSKNKIREVVCASKERGVPIRIGVNAGSLEKDLLEKYREPSALALVESACRHIRILEDLNYDNIVVSLKASNVLATVEANELFSKKYNYPLHLGVTEAGLIRSAAVKSGIGIGYLLMQGIGDTIRVSITGSPLEEVRVAKDILKSLNLYEGKRKMVEVISCPTCGRTEIDLIGITEKLSEAVSGIEKNLKIAVMGCVVNGPGEGKEADIGVAGGKGKGVIFKKGKIVKTVSMDQIVPTILDEVYNYSDEEDI